MNEKCAIACIVAAALAAGGAEPRVTASAHIDHIAIYFGGVPCQP